MKMEQNMIDVHNKFQTKLTLKEFLLQNKTDVRFSLLLLVLPSLKNLKSDRNK